jgi:hypothetical protein
MLPQGLHAACCHPRIVYQPGATRAPRLILAGLRSVHATPSRPCLTRPPPRPNLPAVRRSAPGPASAPPCPDPSPPRHTLALTAGPHARRATPSTSKRARSHHALSRQPPGAPATAMPSAAGLQRPPRHALGRLPPLRMPSHPRSPRM